MENGQADNSANKLEVIEVLRVDARMRINLKGVIVVRGILEETVERIKHLMRKQKEEFPAIQVSRTCHLMLSGVRQPAYLDKPP